VRVRRLLLLEDAPSGDGIGSRAAIVWRHSGVAQLAEQRVNR
jgi:hypothetical protein